jgi:hypothetical protein
VQEASVELADTMRMIRVVDPELAAHLRECAAQMRDVLEKLQTGVTVMVTHRARLDGET